MKRTRAIEVLERAGLPYEVRSYNSEGFASAVEVAEKLGLSPSAVFKTLVARGDRSGMMLALLPGDHNLSLRKLAQLAGNRRAEMVDPEELMRLTGYIKGGVSPLGAKRRYPTYIDDSALKQERGSISAGVRGSQILIAPQDLIQLTSAVVADLQDQRA